MKRLLLGYFLFGWSVCTWAEVLGHISDDTAPAEAEPHNEGKNQSKIIYRVICAPDDPLPDCQQAPLIDHSGDNQPVQQNTANKAAPAAEPAPQDQLNQENSNANLVERSQATESSDKPQSHSRTHSSAKSAKKDKSHKADKKPVKEKSTGKNKPAKPAKPKKR